ncbi:ATP-binding cassette subfamily B protein [Neorhizobium huautlense]|uniref:ATP-binding cassette subfamily B protein n=1 Tax=Neorhizobium huautlense TaxID=67774 RepID=A0ABT9PMK9_9HYPH|nr:ABC transporter ATP-binding protein [Neorhizobium huautlense]MDP9835697.1 ATP-binding cassette subfamily B protein [Neorhizobium huautlense]
MTAQVTSPGSAIGSDLAALRRLLALAGQWRNRLLFGFFLRLLQSICLGLAFATVLWVLASLIGEPAVSAKTIWPVVLIMAVSLAGQVGFGILAMQTCWLASHRLGGDLRLKMLERLRHLPMGFHLSRDKGETITAMTADIQMLETFFADGFPRIAHALGLPFAAFLLLAVTDWPAALVGLVSIVCGLPFFLWSSRRLAALSARRQIAQADAATRMIEFVQGMKVIRAFNRLDDGWTSFKVALDRFHAISVGMITALAVPIVAFSAVVMLGLPLLVAFIGYRHFAGGMPSGSVVIGLGLMMSLYSPILSLAGVMETARMAESALDRIDRILDAPPLPESARHRKPDGFEICFRNVGFSYLTAKPVLRDVSFVVPERSMTAIVGPSGSGKSTLLNLLSRFWDVEDGNITLGGVDLRDMRFEDLAANIAVVFQDVHLFSGTIAENITTGMSDASHADIEAAARAAQAHDFIMALPKGYATEVGEGGAKLSGGERQRISIARAVLKNAPIVLLDEATAAIDPTNERAIQTALEHLVADRTLIVVAHRLSTIRNADQIIVVDQGHVAETGRHDDLLAQQGLYARLWHLRNQAASWQLGRVEENA